VAVKPGVSKPYCFDTMILSSFACAERLDVLSDLMLGHECWTTTVVLAELRRGADKHPLLVDAINLEWLQVANLDALDQLSCFVKWAGRLGSQERDLGEASVLAAADLRNGVAVTDDREATKVGRRHGAEVHGTIWILAGACRAGKLTRTGAGSIVDALAAVGARLPCTGSGFTTFASDRKLLEP
jgi:predicted nucleic acid-binding protein